MRTGKILFETNPILHPMDEDFPTFKHLIASEGLKLVVAGRDCALESIAQVEDTSLCLTVVRKEKEDYLNRMQTNQIDNKLSFWLQRRMNPHPLLALLHIHDVARREKP